MIWEIEFFQGIMLEMKRLHMESQWQEKSISNGIAILNLVFIVYKVLSCKYTHKEKAKSCQSCIP